MLLKFQSTYKKNIKPTNLNVSPKRGYSLELNLDTCLKNHTLARFRKDYKPQLLSTNVTQGGLNEKIITVYLEVDNLSKKSKNTRKKVFNTRGAKRRKINVNQFELDAEKFLAEKGSECTVRLVVINPRPFIKKRRASDVIRESRKFLKSIKHLRVPKKLTFHYARIFLAVRQKSSELLNNVISSALETGKRHVGVLRNFNKILIRTYKLIPAFKGFKMEFKGRPNGRERGKSMSFSTGKLLLSTIKADIDYHFSEIKTTSGMCSLKTWLLFEPSKVK